jgi:hypothetical protein
MCYLLYGLSITLIHGRMQYAPIKPKSTNQLTDFLIKNPRQSDVGF